MSCTLSLEHLNRTLHFEEVSIYFYTTTTFTKQLPELLDSSLAHFNWLKVVLPFCCQNYVHLVHILSIVLSPWVLLCALFETLTAVRSLWGCPIILAVLSQHRVCLASSNWTTLKFLAAVTLKEKRIYKHCMINIAIVLSLLKPPVHSVTVICL